VPDCQTIIAQSSNALFFLDKTSAGRAIHRRLRASLPVPLLPPPDSSLPEASPSSSRSLSREHPLSFYLTVSSSVAPSLYNMVSFSLSSALQAILLLSSALEISASSHAVNASRHRRHARRGLPSGWTALGCMSDANDRILPDYHFNSDALTLESCVSGCAAKGYTYAGAEFARTLPVLPA
jgi:hypothetical protein